MFPYTRGRDVLGEGVLRHNAGAQQQAITRTDKLSHAQTSALDAHLLICSARTPFLFLNAYKGKLYDLHCIQPDGCCRLEGRCRPSQSLSVRSCRSSWTLWQASHKHCQGGWGQYCVRLLSTTIAALPYSVLDPCICIWCGTPCSARWQGHIDVSHSEHTNQPRDYQ